MLQSLHIKNFVLINEVCLNVEAGLTVFTGETGAGKSIILSALGLCLGHRAPTNCVREGADRAVITGAFLATTAIKLLLEENEIESDDELLIIRRSISASGANKVFINDQPCSLALLKQLAPNLMDIHKQFDRLLDSASHLTVLDAYMGRPALIEEVASHYQKLSETHKKLAGLQQQQREAAHHIEFTSHAVKELEEANVYSEEEDELLAKKQRLKAHEKVVGVLNTIHQALQTTGGVDEKLAKATKAIMRVTPEEAPEVAALSEPLTALHEESLELGSKVSDLLYNYEHDNQSLEEVDERLHFIRQLARKYNVLCSELPTALEEFSHSLHNIQHIDHLLKEAEKAQSEAKEQYGKAAQKLSAARKEAAHSLEVGVLKELSPLGLPRCKFKVSFTALPETQWATKGVENIEFVVDTNATGRYNPLQKVASGGEMARLMLALKVVLASKGELPTMVFDEVDSGVGGPTAAAVGERLKKLSETVQVLVITHSPQVASYGDTHFRVQKKANEADVVQSNVVKLSVEERTEEVARMLAGKELTKESIEAAKRLMH